MAGKKPVFDIRAGGIQVSVWENETEKYGVMRSLTFTKSYKDKAGDWKETQSYKPNDIALLQLCLIKVQEFLFIKDSSGVKEEF